MTTVRWPCGPLAATVRAIHGSADMQLCNLYTSSECYGWSSELLLKLLTYQNILRYANHMQEFLLIKINIKKFCFTIDNFKSYAISYYAKYIWCWKAIWEFFVCLLLISFIKRFWLKRASILLRGPCGPFTIIVRPPCDGGHMKRKYQLTGPVRSNYLRSREYSKWSYDGPCGSVEF